MKKVLSYRELNKIMHDTRRETERGIKMCAVGDGSDIKDLYSFLGPIGAKVIEEITDGKKMPDAETDLAIFTFSAAAAVPPWQREVSRKCRLKGLEVVAIIDAAELGEAAKTAKKAEAELAFGLSPGRVIAYEPEMSDTEADKVLQAIIDKLPGHEVALAANVPIFRPLVTEKIISGIANENGVIGFVNFFPGTDMPMLTVNQMRMVLKIAAAHGIPLTWSRARELLLVLGGGFTFRALARQIVGLVPLAGWFAKGAVAYGGTKTVGLLARQYFENIEEPN